MWLSFSHTAKHTRTSRSYGRSFRPRLLALEDRWCPSGGALQWSETLPTSAIVNARATAVQPADGKIVTVGADSNGRFMVTRLNPNGTLDTTFNGTGTVAVKIGTGDYAGGQAVAIQSNGQIVVGGNTQSGSWDQAYVVARLNTNGSLDKNFGTKGVFVYNPTAYEDYVRSLAILPNGIIVAGGGQNVQNPTGVSDFAALELTPAGKLNTAFGSGGVALVSHGYGHFMDGMAVVPGTGQIVMAGYAIVMGGGTTLQSVQYGCVAMLTAGGQPDLSFNGTGSLISGSLGYFNSAAVQGNAASGYKIVLGGAVLPTSTSPSLASVTRYTLSGALDASFGGAGTGTLTIGGGHHFRSLALAADGTIIVGGYQRYVASDGTTHDQMSVGHLSADGVVDTSFGSDGTGFSFAQVSANSQAYSVAIDPATGDIVLGGYTRNTLGTASGAGIARFGHP